MKDTLLFAAGYFFVLHFVFLTLNKNSAQVFVSKKLD